MQAELARALAASVGARTSNAGKYEAFERFIRHDVYGEPAASPASVGGSSFQPTVLSSKFYPKLKVLHEAIKRTGMEHVFDDVLPIIIKLAVAPPGSLAPCEPGEIRSMLASEASGFLANAVLLNVVRGSALDFLGGGVDPLYVSGATVAVEKACAMYSSSPRIEPRSK